MAVPHVYLHQLDTLKGWFTGTPTDFVAKLSANVTVDPVPAGRCAYLNDDGEFELGCTGKNMPIFLRNASDDFDVANDGDGANDAFGWTPIHPSGDMGGLVAIGGGEVATTEYDTTAGVTFLPNDLLHSPTAAEITGSDKSAAGKVYNKANWPGGDTNAFVQYEDHICGLVSRGLITNMHRRQLLAFWPIYMPASA